MKDLRQDEGRAATERNYNLDDNFVRAASNPCSERWEHWVSNHARAVENDNVLVFQLFAGIGNLFISLGHLLAVAQFLGTGVALDWQQKFPGFRQAFEPARISWDTDTALLRQHALDIEQGRTYRNDLHAKTFRDGMMLLSNAQFELLKATLDIQADNLTHLVSIVRDPTAPRKMRKFLSPLVARLSRGARIEMGVEPCVWNMFLRLSPSMRAAIKTYSPWSTEDYSFRFKDYVAWHLRIPTEADKKIGYNPLVHRYMIRETPDVVCSSFLEAMEGVRQRCPTLFTNDTQVYISSISSSLGSMCIDYLAAHDIQGVQVDMGLNADEAHTSFNHNSDSAINAFLDYMFMMEAKAIIRTGSSFSGTVVRIRGMVCLKTASADNQLSERGLVACVPKSLDC